MERKQRDDNRQVHDYRKVYDRLGTDTYLEETHPIAKDAVPVLIEPELWDQAESHFGAQDFQWQTRKNQQRPPSRSDVATWWLGALCKLRQLDDSAMA